MRGIIVAIFERGFNPFKPKTRPKTAKNMQINNEKF